MQPVISVIIPTLNEEKYLPNLLNDLKKQTQKQFEVLIIDAHSTDETKKQALLFSHDLNLHFIESPKRHLSFQRNYATEKAKGSYLFFIDADSRIAADAIEKATAHIKKEQHKLYLPIIQSGNPHMKYKILVKITVLSVILLQKIGMPLSIGPIILIQKGLFDSLGGFSLTTTASEDHNLVIKAYKVGVKANFISDVHCFFSMRRLERDGIANVLWKYLIFTIETLVKGGVYKKSTQYEMGGQNYKSSITNAYKDF